jgi:uncharacterized protein (TIGR00375 family)
MTQIISDLQIHSKYARAVSQQMVIPEIAKWAKIKGIGLMATGDWTHPLWYKELQANLEEDGSGILKVKNDSETGVKFLLSGEVSCIYSQGGKGRRVHTLIFAPDFSTVEKINTQLVKLGCNLMSDGRPIIGLTSIQLAEAVFGINKDCLIVPAHVWTPWFALFGSMSGFDSIAEAFGLYADKIYAVETGLSSDPAMNWRIKELDNRSILSFSDAHSGPKIGREATVFQTKNIKKNCVISFKDIAGAIKQDASSDWEIGYTIEFYPEEGKYHYTGHRACGVRQSPEETNKNGIICPACGKPLTVGVMHRVEKLAGRTEKDLQITKKEIPNTKISGIYNGLFPNRPPYLMLVPLQEIIAESINSQTASDKVQGEYQKITRALGGEFNVLINSSMEEITAISGAKIAEGIQKVRTGNIVIDPGYDGVFGVVKIWGTESEKLVSEEKKQLTLF